MIRSFNLFRPAVTYSVSQAASPANSAQKLSFLRHHWLCELLLSQRSHSASPNMQQVGITRMRHVAGCPQQSQRRFTPFGVVRLIAMVTPMIRPGSTRVVRCLPATILPPYQKPVRFSVRYLPHRPTITLNRDQARVARLRTPILLDFLNPLSRGTRFGPCRATPAKFLPA